MFSIVTAAAGALPTWYLANRVHAHTRLRIKDYCHNGTGAWACEPLFEHAGAAFASLGVPAYVRHTHSADEGLWWPSTTDSPDAPTTNKRTHQQHLPFGERRRRRLLGYMY